MELFVGWLGGGWLKTGNYFDLVEKKKNFICFIFVSFIAEKMEEN